MTTTPPDAQLENARWDLSALYADIDDPQLIEDIATLAERYGAFESRYKGRLSKNLGEALVAFEALERLTNGLFLYLYLRHYADLNDQAVISRLREAQLAIDAAQGAHGVFFEDEIAHMDDADYARLLETDARCTRVRAYLDKVRRSRPYMLTAEVEGALAKRRAYGADSWSQFYDEAEADLRFDFEGQQRTLTEMLHILSVDGDGERRAACQRVVNDGLGGPFVKFSAQCLNMVVGAKRIEDKERGYAHPMAFRNINNMVSDGVVETLHRVVIDHVGPLAQRYYRLKAHLMGRETLRWSDRNAPLPFDDSAQIPYATALRWVTEAFAGFSPKLADLVQNHAAAGRIDAPARSGKRSGAFNYSCVVGDGQPMAFTHLNYLGSARDVMTLAHELGHGVHGLLAGEAQGALQASPPMALAETASIFAEMTAFNHLRSQPEANGSPQQRMALLCGKIEDMLNTVLRQIGFSLFEQRVHNAGKRLDAATLNGWWRESVIELYGPEGETFTYADIDCLWSYVSHFHNPFYVYAYALGELLTQSLHARRDEYGEAFEPLLLDLLRAGGSKDLVTLLQPFAVDPERPQFWIDGVQASLGKLIPEAEETARSLG
ncbi:M3 family metallopeptidase [Magnetofaba australis]|uniref:Putative peptidase M3A and M3B, thimet/oligopeptidase F n=1 Tax=Magnetofaba australis IT-1 TaxID=1434232 RepID=A0A1Y2K269_9PROT|nr:M3 family metallopeptidase [Magnetofaba australis]OSM02141.1 putative peptidase M3A and M3B, thimet/oligopeptidase F [Magnetofaba australis IT-1]